MAAAWGAVMAEAWGVVMEEACGVVMEVTWVVAMAEKMAAAEKPPAGGGATSPKILLWLLPLRLHRPWPPPSHRPRRPRPSRLHPRYPIASKRGGAPVAARLASTRVLMAAANSRAAVPSAVRMDTSQTASRPPKRRWSAHGCSNARLELLAPAVSRPPRGGGGNQLRRSS